MTRGKIMSVFHCSSLLLLSRMAALMFFFSDGVGAGQYQVITEDLRPLQYKEAGELTGASVDVVEKILLSMGESTRIEMYPWSRAFQKVKSEPKSVLFSIAKTPDRTDLFKWVGPLFVSKVYLYKRRNSDIDISSLDDAKKVNNILLVRDFPEHDFLENQKFNNLIPVVKPELMFKMLASGRGDLVPAGELTVLPYLEKYGLESDFLKRTSVMLFEHKLYIALSRDTPDAVVTRWQQSLDTLKLSGEYASILKRYKLLP